MAQRKNKKKSPNRMATPKAVPSIRYDEEQKARAQFAAMSLAMRQAYNYITEGCDPECLLEVAADYRAIADE